LAVWVSYRSFSYIEIQLNSTTTLDLCFELYLVLKKYQGFPRRSVDCFPRTSETTFSNKDKCPQPINVIKSVMSSSIFLDFPSFVFSLSSWKNSQSNLYSSQVPTQFNPSALLLISPYDERLEFSFSLDFDSNLSPS
jgi:hypothetical protein